ncbi:MAG: hypothetical protein EBX74_01700 [Candidatus Fonsibacter lacus]|uniref:Uncharacterized protein n=1 Tax=Candidatus Fonsibacter lacus TaxID=2576439 RepID=A0A966HPJ8_9PROT|nr:hypothetical protein [Candidatus Fonsibacter lacus]
MADTTRRIVVPKERLPSVNSQFNSYFLRYRIVSEDKNLFSEWSSIHEIPTSKIYSANGQGSILYNTETQQITASWPLQNEISEYDVWYKWSAFSPAFLPTNTRTISNAVLNSTTGKITYTTSTYPGYGGPTHTYNVGDIVTVNGCGTSQFNLRDYIIEEVPNRTSFVISNKSYIGQSYAFTTSGYVYQEVWEYAGRIAGNTINFYQKLPADVSFSIRVYTPHYPISHNNNYLIFAYLDKTT